MVDFGDIFGGTNGGEEEPLPEPSVEVPMQGFEGPWTASHVTGVIANPVYAGIGPYPSLVSDEQWVRAAAKLIEDDGAEQFLVNLLHVLREMFEQPGESD